MLNIGCHLSISKGYLAMGKNALKIGANTFQFFTRNPRGGKAKAIEPSDTSALLDLMRENGFTALLAHAPYTLNVCSANENTRNFSIETMADDLLRLEHLPNSMYNFHPGSHGGQGEQVGIELIVKAINNILKPEQSILVLLETMAGKGSELGCTFEELRQILDGVALREKVGVCIDTCHVYAAGYDIVNNLDGVLEYFDKVIGLDKLYAVHLNDSLNQLGSRKDRHAKIGKGFIGLEAIVRIINHPALCHLPFLLETPNDLEGYASEIRLLRDLYKH